MADRVGRVFLPREGTGVASFSVLVDDDKVGQVAVGSPLAADTVGGRLVGVVTDVKVVGTESDPVLSANLAPTPAPSAVVQASDATVATVQVFDSPALRPPRGGPVFHADAADVSAMTSADSLSFPVPAGVVELADGSVAPLCLDGEELLGPLAAHLVVGGRSGAAAKTSFVSVLLASTLAASESAGRSCGAVLFNVKGTDLLALDRPPSAPLSDFDVAAYEVMGVPAKPFTFVSYYAPTMPGGTVTRSRRADALPVRWGLRDVWSYLSLLDRRFYDNDQAASLTADLWALKVETGQATTLDAVVAFLSTELEKADEMDSGHIWRSHHTATARKLLRAFRGLVSRTGGLVTGGDPGVGCDVPDRLSAGEVVVVDIAGLEPSVQGAVVARTLRRLLASAEERDGVGGGLGVDHLVVFADELNVFAPASGDADVRRVREALVRLAATGRYAGVSLWGAAQFPSAIAGGVRDNASTLVLGAVAETELDSGVYGRIPSGVREQIVTASRGQMVVRSANVRGWAPLRFPRPAWAAGVASEPGLRARPVVTDVLGLSSAAVANVTAGVHPDVVAAVVTEAEGDTAKAVQVLDTLNTPDMRRITGGEPASSYDPRNPWAVLDD